MDEQFELIIDVQTKGIRATEREIASATNALDNLNREGKVTPEVFDHLSRSLVAQNNKLKTGAAQWRNYANSVKAARDIQRGTLASGLKGIQGTGSFLGGAQAKSMQDEFRAIQATSDARRKASDEAVAGIARMEAATGRGAEAERRLNSERARGFQTSNQLMGAWDKEFNALTRSTNAKRENVAQSNALRYANYDLANTLLRTAAVMGALGVATTAAFAVQERAFADVERTLAPGTYAVGELRSEINGLTREIPQAYTELAKVATLGNQLGVAGDRVADFTRNVTQFSTITGVTVEETALAFGQLENLLPDIDGQYRKLGSSIALVGVNSAATEAQIIAVAREIAPAAASAGFAANEVIGLSGALASLKVPPERSRSTVLQFFETLNMAVANGGADLENFATVVGTTAGELEAMVRRGEGANILQSFLGNVSTQDTVAVTQALQALGLAGLRTNPTIRALSGNMELLNQTFADGARGWQEGTELQRQYAVILETLSAKWQLFLNSLMNAGAAIGGSVAPAMKLALDVATDLLNGLADFASSPVGETMMRLAANALALVAAWAALRGGIALATATAFAFKTATSFIGGGGLIKAVMGLAQAWGVYTPAVEGATRASWNARGALLALGRATLVLAVLQAITELVFNFGGAMEWLGDVLVNVGNALGVVSAGLPEAFKNGAKQIGDFGSEVSKWGKGLQKSDDDAGSLDSTLAGLNGTFEEGTGAVEDFGLGLDSANEKVRTLTDYASDLSSVWTRAFEIRFSGQNTLDTITSSFISLRDAAEQSRLRMMGLRAEIQGLASNINIQETFLKVALEYGDTTRAQAIEAELAKLRADLANKTADLNKEQESQNKTLTGNSAAAIANRKTITDLVTQYQAHIQALAASGLSAEELKRQTDLLQADFIAQATQLGFNQQELGLYSLAFQDVTTAISNVPRDITVTFNADPAIQALNEFAARAAQIGQQAGDAFGAGLSGGAEQGAIDAQQRVTEVLNQAYSGILAFANSFGGSTGRSGAGRGGGGGGGGGFAGGGYTGRGGMYEPAGIVHRGEYVIPKRYVNQSTGLPYSDALGRYQRGATGRTSYAGGGYVTGSRGGRGVMDISATSLQQLAMLIDKVIAVDGKVIGETASRSYQTGTATGRN